MVGLENEWYYTKEVGRVYNLQGNNTGQQLRGRKWFDTFRISWIKTSRWWKEKQVCREDIWRQAQETVKLWGQS